MHAVRILEFRFVVTFSAILWLICDQAVETGAFGEKHRLTLGHWELFHMFWMGFEPGQW